MQTGERRSVIKGEGISISANVRRAKPLEEGAAADVELTDEELAGVAGGISKPVTEPCDC